VAREHAGRRGGVLGERLASRGASTTSCDSRGELLQTVAMGALHSTIGGVIVAVFILGLLLGNGLSGVGPRLRSALTRETVNTLFSGVLAFATLTLVIAAIYQHNDAVDALELSQRAWIAPTEIKIDPEIPLVEGAKSIAFQLAYQNVGRGPAADLKISQQFGAFLLSTPFTSDQTQIPENNTCDGRLPLMERGTVYPSRFSSDINVQPYNGIPDINPEQSIREIIAGARLVYINGCFLYNTMGASHLSAFCVFLFPDKTKPVEKWRFVTCRKGSWAN
jgi:hypothetical protein